MGRALFLRDGVLFSLSGPVFQHKLKVKGKAWATRSLRSACP